MANEIQAAYTAGFNLYAIILDPATGKVWNGSGFEAPLAADWGSYAVALAQQSTTPLYETNFPAGITAPALYSVVVYKRVGATPATTDVALGVGAILWSGTALLPGDVLARPIPASYPGGSAGFALGKLLVSFGVSIVQPPTLDSLGNINVVQGLDYFNADGQAIMITDTANVWPTLTGATVAMNLNPVGTAGAYQTQTVLPMTVVTATGNAKQIRLEVSRTQTAALSTWLYRYRIIATLTNGDKVNLGVGDFTVNGA